MGRAPLGPPRGQDALGSESKGMGQAISRGRPRAAEGAQAGLGPATHRTGSLPSTWLLERPQGYRGTVAAAAPSDRPVEPGRAALPGPPMALVARLQSGSLLEQLAYAFGDQAEEQPGDAHTDLPYFVWPVRLWASNNVPKIGATGRSGDE